MPLLEAGVGRHRALGFSELRARLLLNFPNECRHVLEVLRKVYVVDAECKRLCLSREERLARHQRDSAPVMKDLQTWMQAELDEKRVEPNSELGKTYKYMLKRWGGGRVRAQARSRPNESAERCPRLQPAAFNSRGHARVPKAHGPRSAGPRPEPAPCHASRHARVLKAHKGHVRPGSV